MLLDAPAIEFSPWRAWRDRPEMRSDDPHLGVYAWAHFHEPPASGARPFPDLPDGLIYVGETKNLNNRPLGAGHHRLQHYRATFPRDVDLELLYVSVFRAHCYDPADSKCRELRAFTRYVEDLVYWEYTRKFGIRPALDYKRRVDRGMVKECCAVK